ncbi:hypothetical protein [Azospirillum sp. SYSU D00513]|uniref:hypothetical protein n=1 Tax=Azospirillum sp. SYSU D00513 TaxID=2812561 RepID=UPI001A96398F|nr:hypothetical protein [Azospirillum sp. SYSU D00513]
MDGDISFAEVMLRKGAELIEQKEAVEPTVTVDSLARLLATLALTDGPLVIHSEGGAQPELFDEAARLSAKGLGDKVTALATARQAERAVLFEFDGTGPLTGSRVIAAVLRPEAREDLLDAYIAVGRVRNGAAEMTAAPASVRFDAAALARTLEMVGPAVQASANAATAALAHAARVQPLPGQEAPGIPALLLELFWHAFCLSTVRAHRARPTLH